MSLLLRTSSLALLFAFAVPSADNAADATRAMTSRVERIWPDGVVQQVGHPGSWGYEVGILLDGVAAEAAVRPEAADYAYLKAAVDRFLLPDGTIRMDGPDKPVRAYPAAEHTLDDIELGRAVLVVYELLLMDEHMRDRKTGLLRHGWDETKQMPWADKTTGLSPEAWARADGWYAMALVDVLDVIPEEHPKREALIADLKRTIAAVLRYQDAKTGLWWQVMDQGGRAGNYLEASASCMFTYALAHGVARGYLDRVNARFAQRAWDGIQSHFIQATPDGPVLTTTVRVGGLGGKPYRSGDYAYYVGEKVQDDDPKGIGSYLKAGAAMQAMAAWAEQRPAIAWDREVIDSLQPPN
jgi:rhamnogalacturonyl hydrolase YesR